MRRCWNWTLAWVLSAVVSLLTTGILLAEERSFAPRKKQRALCCFLTVRALTVGMETGRATVEDGKLFAPKKAGSSIRIGTRPTLSSVWNTRSRREGTTGSSFVPPLKAIPASQEWRFRFDDYASKWGNLKPEQYNGSIYGMPYGQARASEAGREWNDIEVYAKGHHIRDINNAVIVDADVSQLGKRRSTGSNRRDSAD